MSMTMKKSDCLLCPMGLARCFLPYPGVHFFGTHATHLSADIGASFTSRQSSLHT